MSKTYRRYEGDRMERSARRERGVRSGDTQVKSQRRAYASNKWKHWTMDNDDGISARTSVAHQ